MANAYFLHQIKHNSATGAWDKGIVVKDSKPTARENYDDARQSYHAYLSAYAYGHDASIDYVSVEITDELGNRPDFERWTAIAQDGEETE